MATRRTWGSARRGAVIVVALGILAANCSSAEPGRETARGSSARRVGTSGCRFDDPADGGKIVYGLEADTGSPWTPQGSAMAISGHMVAQAVYDPLTLLDDQGEAVPNLATSWTHNGDFTEWTFTIRDGVRFHDGTPLDGAAVAENLIRFTRGLVNNRATRDLQNVTFHGMTVTIRTSRPYAPLPKMLSTQVGYVASPKWLAEVDADPAQAMQPVGTGPFKFESYTPGNGNSFVARCNPDYWRPGLPRLDEVEFRVLEDVQSRSNALLAGEIDALHTANGDEIAKFKERAKQFEMVELADWRQTVYVLLNVSPQFTLTAGASPEANPLADVDVRRALAMATDVESLARPRDAGASPVANGPFPPGSMGYLEDTGYPRPDAAAAREAIARWEAEHGPLVVHYATTSDAANALASELLKEMWESAGAEVKLSTVEQTQFIFQAAIGTFQAFSWRNHGRPDPIFEDVWWNSEMATEPPGIGLNFGRIRDPVIDENLAVIRESADPEIRRVAAEAINRRFGEQVYNLWLSWPEWAVVFKPGLAGVARGATAPDGSDILQHGAGMVGAHSLAQAHWSE